MIAAHDAAVESCAAPATARRHVLRQPIARVTLLGVALVVVAGLAVVGCRCIGEPAHTAAPWIAVVIVAGFAAAELSAFHVQFRKEAISFSLSEVPVAIALAFLDPLHGIAVRVVSGVIAVVIVVRPPLYKLWFNAALFTFETAIAYFVVRTIADPAAASDQRFLVAVVIGVAFSSVVGSLAVALAVACFEGNLRGRLASGWRVSAAVMPITTTLAALTVAPALLQPELVVLAILPIAAVWFVLRRHGQLVQRYGDLEAMHGFAAAVGRSLQLDRVVDAAVVESARLLRAERCVLHVFGPDGTLAVSGVVGAQIGQAPAALHDVRWREVLDATTVVGCRLDRDDVVQISQAPVADIVAAPIHDTDGTVGVLVVAERAGQAGAFDSSDFSRLQTVVGQLAPNLRKALMHASIEHAATHDALTGGPNRSAFERAVDEVLANRLPTDCTAVMLLDLDRFKEVNDTLGHHAGDRVLVQFAERVVHHLAPRDVLARLAGDEFAVLVHRSEPHELADLARDLLAEARVPFGLDGLDVVVTASIGIAPITDGDADASTVLRRADIAMYAAKKAHAGYEIYREEIDRRTPARLSLLGDLRRALELRELTVEYQPKIDLASRTVVGAEALVRWHHPGRGWVPPIDFVRVAEETGLIKLLTDQVLHQALATVRSWQDAGYDLGVSINLSTHDLLDELLVDRVAHRIEQCGLEPHKITLEITESSLLSDAPRTMSTIQRLDELGVQLSVDDFGTGYSSLSYLRRLPVSEIKIDRSFVLNLLLDEQDEVIVRSTIDLGHNLGMLVVAEGIENSPVLDRLGVLACDIGQGYGISRPLRPELFMAWLATTEYRVPKSPIAPASVR